MADVVASADLGQGFACLSPRQGFEDLVAAELELTAEPHPARFGPDPALAGPGQD